MQGRVPMVVLHLEVGPIFNQELDDVQVTFTSRQMQSRVAKVFFLIDLNQCCQQF